jgi:hypothetical protein
VDLESTQNNSPGVRHIPFGTAEACFNAQHAKGSLHATQPAGEGAGMFLITGQIGGDALEVWGRARPTGAFGNESSDANCHWVLSMRRLCG